MAGFIYGKLPKDQMKKISHKLQERLSLLFKLWVKGNLCTHVFVGIVINKYRPISLFGCCFLLLMLCLTFLMFSSIGNSRGWNRETHFEN